MSSESVLVAPRETSEGTLVTVELPQEVWDDLAREHARLASESNPSPLSWDRFMSGCIAIGLDQLKRLSVDELLDFVLEELEA